MKTIRVSATDARNNFFSILNQVLYGNSQVIIKKAGASQEALLVAKAPKEKELERRMKMIEETYGILKDVPVTRIADTRLKGKRAKVFLRRLRQGNV